MKRVFWILVTPILTIAIISFLGSKFVLPKLERWSLHKGLEYANTTLPIKITAQDLKIQIFKPSITLEKVSVQLQGEMAKLVPHVQAESFRVRVDPFQLLLGKLGLAAIIIDSPEFILHVDPLLASKEPPKELPIDKLFNHLEQIPLERVFVRDLQFQVVSEKLNLKGDLQRGDLLLTNLGQSLTGKLSIPNLGVTFPQIGRFGGGLKAHLLLNRQALKIVQLGLRLNKSEATVSGEINPISRVSLEPKGIINIDATVLLSELHQEITRLQPELKIPSFSGGLGLDIEAQLKGDLQKTEVSAVAQTTALQVLDFDLGAARIEGQFKNKTIKLSEVQVLHPAGQANVTSSQLSLDENLSFKALVNVDKLDLHRFFETINLEKVPVGMTLQGKLPCQGQLKPEILLTCDNVTLAAQDLWVKGDLKPKTPYILQLDSMKAEGQLTLTTSLFKYQSALLVGSSRGSSEGVVDFKKGFEISYITPQLDFKDVRNLANLKIKGFASLEGTTSGDTHAAVFNMTANGRNFNFEDFYLGNLITDLSYKSGVLTFKDVAGAIEKTQYLGSLSVDLEEKQLTGQISAPTIDLKDVVTLLAGLYEFPLEVQGQGALKAEFSGPLSLWKMNYKLQSAFKKPELAGEQFDILNLDVHADQGHLKTDLVQLKKGNSTLVLKGDITPDQKINFFADGKQWRLENSNFISQINSNIVGELNMAAELKGDLREPRILLKGAVTDTLFEDQEVPNSNFIVDINRQQLGTQISLFGNKVLAELQVPLQANRAPLLIKLKTQNWDYSTLLGLVGGANLATEYDSNLTADIELRSPSGEFLQSTGQINIDELSLKRGMISLKNDSPIRIQAQNGVLSIRDFKLTGQDSELSLKGSNFTAQDLNITAIANLDIRLLQIFLPFLDNLGGLIQSTATISGPYTRPSVLGHLRSDGSLIKIRDFPHTIERLVIDVAFSQSRILFNSLKGQMAGGTLSGDGSILINGIRDLPLSIRLNLDNVTLNVPDRVRTSGNANLLISGKWFPFTMSGTYQILSAQVEKEFTESNGAANVRQSYFLPKVIREKSFEPLVLDIQLVMQQNINVKNSLIDGSVEGHLRVKGPPGNPILLGKINTQKNSKLIFKDKIFTIQTGDIEFTDPDEINPILYVTATSRIDEYDITVLAQGPSKNMAIRLSSIPPLSETDIISLIALGVTNSNLEQNLTSRGQAEQLSYEIGGAVLAKPINQQLENTLGLGLQFQVTNQYDSTRNISVPKITLSRQVSDRLKVSGSRSAKDSQYYDIKMEYFLNNNVTAVGSFENRGFENEAGTSAPQETQSIFGLDLEYKREFK